MINLFNYILREYLRCDEFGVDLPINIFATNPAIATAIANDDVLFETNSPKKTRTMS